MQANDFKVKFVALQEPSLAVGSLFLIWDITCNAPVDNCVCENPSMYVQGSPTGVWAGPNPLCMT